jgi:hypothetical protein
LRVLVDQFLQFGILEVLFHIILKSQNNFSTSGDLLSNFIFNDLEVISSLGYPNPLILSSLSTDNGNLAGNQEIRVKSNTELTDQI